MRSTTTSVHEVCNGTFALFSEKCSSRDDCNDIREFARCVRRRQVFTRCATAHSRYSVRSVRETIVMTFGSLQGVFDDDKCSRGVQRHIRVIR